MAKGWHVAVDASRATTAFKALEHLPKAQALVLNRVTTRVRQRVVPVLAQQTGLNRRIITRAVRVFRASASNLRAGVVSRGGNVSYRYFQAREVPGGVRVVGVHGGTVTLDGHYFRRLGRSPNRFMVKKLNGQVYFNASGRWKGEIGVEKSGVFIPVDMVRGASLQAYDDVVAAHLPAEIARELAKFGA